MGNELAYMLGVVAVGWAVTFGMRALPFLLFAGRGRSLPPQVERLGALVSPVIIAALVVYSYSGLQWRTAWPYLAGALTVAVHLWKGSPLASIAAGTALYMLLVGTSGCVSTPEIDTGVFSPTIRVRPAGVFIGEQRSTPQGVVSALRDAGVPCDQTVHIQIERDASAVEARRLMGFLFQNGYKRPVLVTPRQGLAAAGEERRRMVEEDCRRAAAREEAMRRGAQSAPGTPGSRQPGKAQVLPPSLRRGR